MTDHPHRNRLAAHGGWLLTLAGVRVVELRDLNDNSHARYQYRRVGIVGVQRRVLMADGRPLRDGSPWETISATELAAMQSVRGDYHPVLDPLGITARDVLAAALR